MQLTNTVWRPPSPTQRHRETTLITDPQEACRKFGVYDLSKGAVHMSNLKEVFRRFKKANMRFNSEKWQFFRKEMMYLGD